MGLGLFAVTAPAFAGTPEPAPEDAELTQPVVVVEERERTYYISGFAGRLTENSQHEVWQAPTDIDWLDSYILGGAVGFERPTRWSQFDIGAELQIAKWSGDDDHWEFNAMPVVGRYRFGDWSGNVLRSFSFGLGLSYASEKPQSELEKDGESNRLMIYWAAEIEFGDTEANFTPFLKIHHRSNAFGLIEEETGSNSVALGLRRRF